MNSKVRLVMFLWVVPLLSLASQAAWAGDRDHEDGFFLRLSAGGGAARTAIDVGGSDLEMSGGAGEMNFAIGLIVTPNLALHGTLFGWLVSDPEGEYDRVSETLNADLSCAAFGGGLTYYLMPANVYLSGSIGAGTLSLESHGVTVETKTGFVTDISVGKEWWVGRKWGLGVAGGFGYHSIPEKGVDENWSGTSFAVRFSATLN